MLQHVLHVIGLVMWASYGLSVRVSCPRIVLSGRLLAPRSFRAGNDTSMSRPNFCNAPFRAECLNTREYGHFFAVSKAGGLFYARGPRDRESRGTLLRVWPRSRGIHSLNQRPRVRPPMVCLMAPMDSSARRVKMAFVDDWPLVKLGTRAAGDTALLPDAE